MKEKDRSGKSFMRKLKGMFGGRTQQEDPVGGRPDSGKFEDPSPPEPSPEERFDSLVRQFLARHGKNYKGLKDWEFEDLKETLRRLIPPESIHDLRFIKDDLIEKLGIEKMKECLAYTRSVELLKDWDTSRIVQELDNSPSGDFSYSHLERLITRCSPEGLGEDHRFNSWDLIWNANVCLKQHGIELSTDELEENLAESLDDEASGFHVNYAVASTHIRVTRIFHDGKEYEFSFLTPADVVLKMNRIIARYDMEFLIWSKKGERGYYGDNYDFVLVTKENAGKIIADGKLSFQRITDTDAAEEQTDTEDWAIDGKPVKFAAEKTQ